MILPYVAKVEGYLTALYWLDSDTQEFINRVTNAIKDPPLIRGSTSSADSSDPTFLSADGCYRIDNGKYFHFTYGFSSAAQGIFVTTHFLKVRFVTLPSKTPVTNTNQLFYTFTSDKKLEIYVTFDKRFSMKVGSEVKTTNTYDFNNKQWYHIKIIYTRMQYLVDFYDCSVEIEVIGVGRDKVQLINLMQNKKDKGKSRILK